MPIPSCQITIRLDATAVDYFKQMAAELGMPDQNPIDLFPRDCAEHKRRPTIQWPKKSSKRLAKTAGETIGIRIATAEPAELRNRRDREPLCLKLF